MTFLEAVNSHYVYAHTRNDTDAIFYIGKGSGNRLNGRQQRSDYWKSIVSKANGFKSFVVAGNLTEKEAYKFERLIIVTLQTQTDIALCNLNGGGKGGSYNPSEETRAKQRNAKLGKKLTQEHKDKIRASQVNKVHRKGYSLNLSEEQRKNRAEIAKNHIWTEERKSNISKAKLGHTVSEETKLKISLAKKGVKWNESQRKAMKNARIKEL